MPDAERLIRELIRNKRECEWLEVKRNEDVPEMISKNISALSNGAALFDREYGYMIWGVDDKTFNIVGTVFDPLTKKKGNQDLTLWLRRMISDTIDFNFETVQLPEGKVVLLTIEKAVKIPTEFDGVAYIRVNNSTTNLDGLRQIKKKLIDKLEGIVFETKIARYDLTPTNILTLLNHSAFFRLKKLTVPTGIEGIVQAMVDEKLVEKQDDGRYSITNMGAILFANKLSDFSDLSFRKIRVIYFRGTAPTDPVIKDTEMDGGYASSLDDICRYVGAFIESEETFPVPKDGGFIYRKTTHEYPPDAVRELIANGILHQDYSIEGMQMFVEIFSDRIKISTPGLPLIDTDRFINTVPKERNKMIADLMHRLNLCEKRGMGWDTIIRLCEEYRLPAPDILAFSDATIVTLYKFKKFSELGSHEKKKACYQHACLLYANSREMSNASLRERFGLPDTQAAPISRLIRDSVNAKLIKPSDKGNDPSKKSYIPEWA